MHKGKPLWHAEQMNLYRIIYWTVAISVVSIVVIIDMIRYDTVPILKRRLCKMCLIFTSLLTWQPNMEWGGGKKKMVYREKSENPYTLTYITFIYEWNCSANKNQYMPRKQNWKPAPNDGWKFILIIWKFCQIRFRLFSLAENDKWWAGVCWLEKWKREATEREIPFIYTSRVYLGWSLAYEKCHFETLSNRDIHLFLFMKNIMFTICIWRLFFSSLLFSFWGRGV